MSTAPIDFAARSAVQSMDGFWNDDLAHADPEIAAAIGKELARQRDKIELIASENIASRAVLEAAGSVFTNKYAEGYPGKRYYGGCDYADVVETLAIERAKQLFGCNFANVQPNSGSQMNQWCSSPCSIRATPSWGSTSIRAGTLPTARRLT